MPNKTKQNTKNSTEQICSQPLYKSQTTHHTQPTPTTQRLLAGCAGNHHQQVADAHTVLNVNPTVCLKAPHHQTAAEKRFIPNPKTHPHPPPTIRAVNTCRHKKTTNTPTTRPTCCIVPHKTGLPRKEVIQPHLPVRLPCYDFVPIANPTFDHSPRQNRLGHGLRVLPTFVT